MHVYLEKIKIKIREPVKKNVENSTFGGGSGPGHFPHFKKKKKKLKNKVVFKMHFKPFQAILDHVFFNFFGWLPPRKFLKKSLKKHGLKWLKGP